MVYIIRIKANSVQPRTMNIIVTGEQDNILTCGEGVLWSVVGRVCWLVGGGELCKAPST